MALNYKSSLSRYRRYLQMVQSRPLLATSLWVIFSLVLLIVLLVLALRPTLITIADLMSKINQQKEVSNRLEKQMLTLQEASTNLSEAEGKMYLLDLALPKEVLWSELSSNLVGMATSSGVVPESIIVSKIPLSPSEQLGTKQNPVVVSMPQGVIPVRFTVVAEGDNDQIRNLVEQIEKTGRVSIINLVQVDLTKEGGYRATIRVETGYLPEKFVL